MKEQIARPVGEVDVPHPRVSEQLLSNRVGFELSENNPELPLVNVKDSTLHQKLEVDIKRCPHTLCSVAAWTL